MKALFRVLVLLPSLLSTQASPETHHAPIVLTHIAVIDTNQASVQQDMTVLIIGDHIAEIGKPAEIKVPKAAQVVDGRGKFLIPGLWDMHVHIFGGARFPIASPLLIANGITGVREMGTCVPLATVNGIRKQIAEGELLGPRIVAAGPVVDGGFKDWTNLNVTTPSEARVAVRFLKQQGADFIKIYDNLPRPVFFAIVDESRKQNIPFVGHVPDTVSDREASASGQKNIEHLVGIPAACSTEEAQLQQQYEQALAEPDFSLANTIAVRADIHATSSFSAARCEELATVFRAHGTWQCPTLVAHRVGYAYDASLKNDWRLKYIPKDWVSEWGSFPEEDLWFKDLTPADRGLVRLFHHLVETVTIFHREGVDLLAGTDVSRPYISPGFSLHDELALLVQAGLTPGEALKTATYNPAKFLGMLNRLGTVEQDKLADLVLLDANPLDDIRNTRKISAVVLNGRYLDRTELDKLLADSASARK